jgi:hypothetical protein
MTWARAIETRAAGQGAVRLQRAAPSYSFRGVSATAYSEAAR